MNREESTKLDLYGIDICGMQAGFTTTDTETITIS